MARAGGAPTWAAVVLAVVGGADSAVAAVESQAAPRGPCRAAVSRQLREWGAEAPARPQPPGADGATIRHWPTGALGVWIVEAARDDGTRLSRVSATHVTDVAWRADCARDAHERPRPVASGERFTDADLAALMRAHPRGVVYLWSPHMPLSLDAVAAVRGAAGDRGAHVTVVLAPDADPRFAREAATARGWPADTLRLADAVELQFRDVLIHTPAVIVYAGGRFRGSPWPGAHTRDEYAAYLDRVLAGPP